MIFKNGRTAHQNDQVIWKQPHEGGRVLVGVIFNLMPGLDAKRATCDLAVVRPGGADVFYVCNLRDMYHAEDAWAHSVAG